MRGYFGRNKFPRGMEYSRGSFVATVVGELLALGCAPRGFQGGLLVVSTARGRLYSCQGVLGLVSALWLGVTAARGPDVMPCMQLQF